MDTVLEKAEALGLTVHDDGSVSYPAAGGPEGGPQAPGGTLSAATGFMDEFITKALGITDPNPQRARAQHITDRIAQLLRRLRESGAALDSTDAAALTALRTRPGLDSPGADATGPAPYERGPVRERADERGVERPRHEDCRRPGPQGPGA